MVCGACFGFVYSSGVGVLCGCWWSGVLAIPVGRVSDCMKPHGA